MNVEAEDECDFKDDTEVPSPGARKIKGEVAEKGEGRRGDVFGWHILTWSAQWDAS